MTSKLQGIIVFCLMPMIDNSPGGARQSGNSAVSSELEVCSMCAGIFWMTGGSSILAVMRSSLFIHKLDPTPLISLCNQNFGPSRVIPNAFMR